MSEQPVPEAFRKEFENYTGPLPGKSDVPEAFEKAYENEPLSDNIPQVLMLKKMVLSPFQGKLEEHRDSRDYNGFIEIDGEQAHISVKEIYKTGTIRIIYNLYEEEGNSRSTKVVDLVHRDENGSDRYGLYLRESVHKNGKPTQLNVLTSFISTVYKNGTAINTFNYDAERGLKAVEELTHVVTQVTLPETTRKF